MDFVTEERRFLSLWAYDMSDSELTSVFERIGVFPPPDAPSAQLYYTALTNKFSAEMSGSATLSAAFHEAIIQQSSGQRPFVTVFDNYFGDVTQQGIILDKVDALQSFLTLWPVDNYDQNQASGAYIASYSAFGINNQGASDTGGGALYETVAETAADSMLGGAYAAFAYSKPLGVAQFSQDTHSVNYVNAIASPARAEIKDWTGGWSFNRLQDFLEFFQNIAVQNNMQVNEQGVVISCLTLEDCSGATAGLIAYDPRTPRAFATDTFYSDNLNRFVGPDGRRYIWMSTSCRAISTSSATRTGTPRCTTRCSPTPRTSSSRTTTGTAARRTRTKSRSSTSSTTTTRRSFSRTTEAKSARRRLFFESPADHPRTPLPRPTRCARGVSS